MVRLATLMLFSTACAPKATDKRSDSGEASPRSGELSVLSYNVHGLPSAITGDDTPARLRAIAPKLNTWDIVGLQEDFDPTNHALLADATDHEEQLWFDDMLEGRFYGSGLSIFSRATLIEHRHIHFSACHGLTDSASDCLASKGFQVLRVAAGNASVDIYNTHLEAGGGPEDVAARQSHIDALIASLTGWSEDQAIIFSGDFNLRDSDPDDRPLLIQLKESAQLSQVCVALDCPETDHIDKILFRSSDTLELSARYWANNTEDFKDDHGVDLSDHPPISAVFEWAER